MNGLLYVMDVGGPSKVYVYTTSGQRRAGSDFDLQDNRAGTIAHANGLFHVSDVGFDDDVHAFSTSGERRPEHDFDLDSANSSRAGIDYGDGRFYVLDDVGGRVFVYERSGDGDPQADVQP